MFQAIKNLFRKKTLKELLENRLAEIEYRFSYAHSLLDKLAENGFLEQKKNYGFRWAKAVPAPNRCFPPAPAPRISMPQTLPPHAANFTEI